MTIRLLPIELASAIAIKKDRIRTDALLFTVPFQIRRKGVEARFDTGRQTPEVDTVLLRNVAKAHRWFEMLKQGQSFAEIARQENLSARRIQQLMDETTSGWGTWIRTRTNGVRVRGSTVNLFPTGQPCSAWVSLSESVLAVSSLASCRRQVAAFRGISRAVFAAVNSAGHRLRALPLLQCTVSNLSRRRSLHSGRGGNRRAGSRGGCSRCACDTEAGGIEWFLQKR
jgi:hypothetical protein